MYAVFVAGSHRVMLFLFGIFYHSNIVFVLCNSVIIHIHVRAYIPWPWSLRGGFLYVAAILSTVCYCFEINTIFNAALCP